MEPIMLIIQIIISIVLPVWLCLWFARKVKEQLSSKSKLGDNIPDTHFLMKRWWAEWCIAKRMKSNRIREHEKAYRSVNYVPPHSEKPKTIETDDNCNSMLFYGADQKGNCLFIKFAIRTRKMVEIIFQLVTAEKRIYVLPDYPNTIYTGNPRNKWSAGGFKIEQIQALHRWRITYNGLLRDITDGDTSCDDNIQHVRLNCIYVSNSRPLEWPGEWSTKLHADAIAHEPWRSPQWIKKINLLDYTGLDQFGSIFGQATFKDGSVKTLYLRGIRQPRWGKHESHEFQKAITFLGSMASGMIFYIGAGSTKHSFNRMQFGQVKHSNERLKKVDFMDFELEDFDKDQLIDAQRTLRFVAENYEYTTLVKFNRATTFFGDRSLNWATRLITLDISINGRGGTGIVQLWYPQDGSCYAKPQVPRMQQLKQPGNVQIQKDDYVVLFGDEKCQYENLVGGKGYSLGVLKSVENTKFSVPDGFCVTALAFDLYIESQEEVKRVVDAVVAVSTGKTNGDLQACCEEAMRVIESTPVPVVIKDAIVKTVESLGSSDTNDKYAVRSSAIGEDSEETSAAGQNSTFLGIRGTENIVQSVAKCWASLYSYQSVQYRRQHGLVVKASMGVCIQKMVDAETAGVMFTRQPTTGDPSEIVITANYGLGETVVSAMIEPDTITVERTWEDKLSIKNCTIGSKTQKISMGESGVLTLDLGEQEKEKVCVSEKHCLELASIGLDLEHLFGSPRDIEWAISKDRIFLLQARPITTLSTWTDFELTHELDTTIPSDIDLITFANVGEVFPNPMSPLTISVVINTIDNTVADQQNCCDSIFLNVTAMRCTINYYNSMALVMEKEISMAKKISDIALCGNIMITPEVHKIAHERNGPFSTQQHLKLFYDMVKSAWDSTAVEKKTKELHKQFTLPIDDNDISSLFARIDSKFPYLHEIALYHSQISRVSITYQVISMSLMMRGYDDFTSDHFRDIAILLSSCTEVVSTEVPITLGKIVNSIKANGKDEEFVKVKPTDAIEWLKKNCPPAASKVEALFKEHGHRCIQELDLMSEPWSFKPENLMETIQTLVSSSEASGQSKLLSVEETVASLKTPQTATIRRILKKVVPFCRQAVARREFTKAILVSIIHTMKLAYRKLAALMVAEGYLPSENLIFFLTHQEIGELLNARNPTLIQKAFRRSKLHKQLAKLQYPEVNTGMPMPLKASQDVIVREGSPTIKATSVCSGSILGRACVITDLSQAKEIKTGDILITHATDIGWSPYFPLLGGIVTELGGLISHGAVVAREYGLPCIIGAKGATQMFQTGDTVLLVGDTGVLQMIEKVK